MRRLVLCVFASAALVAGCEDGPNQTYSPAPAGASGVWNGPPGSGGLGDGGAYVPGNSQGYDASFGGTNANDLCTADQEKAVWTKLFQEPIQIPGLAGGIDIAGGYLGDGSSGFLPGQTFAYDPTKETWTGTTVEQAEKILCQGVADSIYFGVTNTIGWGNGCPNCELSALYNVNSRQITDLLFQYGYAGTLDATSADGKTKYSISLNNVPMTATTSAGSQQLILDWTDPTTFNPIVNGLYDALRNTYEPTFPADTDCIAAGHCVIGNNLSGGGYLFFTSLNLAIFVNTTVGTPQANSIPALIDLGLLKLLPFSIGSNLMKLDGAGEGPISLTKNVAGSGKDCKYFLGQTFGDFDTSCLEPLPAGDPNNTIAKNKLFGAMAHTDEVYQFDVNGIDPQFAATLAPTAVIGDTQRPTPQDVAYRLTLDQFEIGTIANDYTNNDDTQPQDWHGLGMLTLEWANLVQHYMQANYGVTSELGDPACMANPASPGVTGKVCSGIEGIVTTAPPSLVALPQQKANALGPAAFNAGPLGGGAPPLGSALAVGLKPGTWYSIFCTDGRGLDAQGNLVGYNDCFGGAAGFAGNAAYYFDTMQDAVAASFGGNPVPATLASRRFYFQQWILALVKYLQSADNPNATLAQIDANPVDANNLFFDSAGGGFETGTYVHRATVNSAQQPPIAVSVTTNLTTSVVNDFDFARYNFRGESAMYSALSTSATDFPGAEALFLSNIVGSPVLAGVYGTYDCAINLDPHNDNCGDIVAPTDPLSGHPLYEGYAPAFGQSVFAIAANGAPTPASPMKVATADFSLIQSAMVTLPVWSNPFDPSSATPQDKTVSVLLPYKPKGANVGFPVTIDGSRDKFYNTENVDFTGTTVNGNVDFEHVAVTDADGGTADQIAIRAIETQNYLGLVFVCAQPSTLPNAVPGQQDILAVRMYQNGQDILDWLSSHPGALSACNIQIKYSVYGNYADFISSLTNGVRIALNPGFGGSVVSDVTLFDPNVVATLGQ